MSSGAWVGGREGPRNLPRRARHRGTAVQAL